VATLRFLVFIFLLTRNQRLNLWPVWAVRIPPRIASVNRSYISPRDIIPKVMDKQIMSTKPWNNTSESIATTNRTTGPSCYPFLSLPTTMHQMLPLVSSLSLWIKDTTWTSLSTLIETLLPLELVTLLSTLTSCMLSWKSKWSLLNLTIRSQPMPSIIQVPGLLLVLMHLSKHSSSTPLSLQRSLLRSILALLKWLPELAPGLTLFSF